jgi:hypothetical protein
MGLSSENNPSPHIRFACQIAVEISSNFF